MTAYLAVESAIAVADRQWQRSTFKRVTTQVKVPNAASDEPLLSLASSGEVTARVEMGGLGRQAPSSETIKSYWKVRPNQVVVNPMWLVGGSVGVSEVSGAVSPAYRVYAVLPDVHPRYLHYVLRAYPYMEQYRLLGRGDTTFDRSVGREDFEGLPVALPPLDAQRRIADFLDSQVSLLERAVKLRRQQVALASQRLMADVTAVYDRAVQDGGAVRLGVLLRSLEQGWSPQCEDRPTAQGEFGVLKAGCVNGGVFRPNEHKALPSDLVPRVQYLVRPGDLLMSRASGSVDLIGSAAVVPGTAPSNLILCDKIYRLRLSPMQDPQFIALMLSCRPVREAIKLGISGAEGMANNLPGGTVRGLRIPVAPLDRQTELRGALLARRTKVAAGQALMARSIELLETRRQALITAAVTGQFDVTTARGGA